MDGQPTILALRRRTMERLTADCASHESIGSVLHNQDSEGIHKLVSIDDLRFRLDLCAGQNPRS